MAQRYYTLLDWVQETFGKAWSSNNNGNLNYLTLTLSQYGKDFGLSAAPVYY